MGNREGEKRNPVSIFSQPSLSLSKRTAGGTGLVQTDYRLHAVSTSCQAKPSYVEATREAGNCCIAVADCITINSSASTSRGTSMCNREIISSEAAAFADSAWRHPCQHAYMFLLQCSCLYGNSQRHKALPYLDHTKYGTG